MSESPFLPIVKRYFEKDPLGAAHLLESMPEEQSVEILSALPPAFSAKQIQHLNDVFASNTLSKLKPELVQEIIKKLQPEQIAAVFSQMNAQVREQLLVALDEKLKSEVREILNYPNGSAGRIMSTKYISLYKGLKVSEAISKIRQYSQRGVEASYAYVVDDDRHLIGIMNMRDMLLASRESNLESIMKKNIFAVNAFIDREKIALEIKARRYFVVPVVDNDNKIIGVVKSDQIIGEMQEEATEDLQKMFGAGGDEKSFSTMTFSLKKRLPWLQVNLATAFLAASVIALFEDIIAQITVLAVFLPVVAGQGGNAGAQSLAIVMRGIVMREIPPRMGNKLILKEGLLGLLTGFITGVVTGLVAWVWHGNPYLGIVLGLAMIVNLFAAGMAGAAIPLILKKVGLDPAQSSSIVLTTVTDIVGFFAFLGFAVLFKNLLI